MSPLHLAVGPLMQQGEPGWYELAFDNFNRDDTEFGSTNIGPNWIQTEVGAADLKIRSFGLQSIGPSASWARWTTAMPNVDQFVEADIVSAVVVGFMLRSTNDLGDLTFYLGQWDSTNKYRIRRYNSGTPTTLASNTVASSPVGVVMRFEVEGSDLVLYRDGTSVVSVTDGSPLTTGDYVGVRLDGTNTTKIDDFTAGVWS